MDAPMQMGDLEKALLDVLEPYLARDHEGIRQAWAVATAPFIDLMHLIHCYKNRIWSNMIIIQFSRMAP